MARVIRAYRRRTGNRVGLKPAGGISTAAQALAWARLVAQELGRGALRPPWFRLGASRLLDDIARALARPSIGRKARRDPTDRATSSDPSWRRRRE
jgi:deoxyribose-phosphate aldolase